MGKIENVTTGYFGIGIYKPRNSTNIGTLWRSAFNFGASFIFTIGARALPPQPSDTPKSFRHIPFYVYPDIQSFLLPTNCFLVGMEETQNSVDLIGFRHPLQACYLLGAEDFGIPPEIHEYCTGGMVSIDSPRCLNVSVAGSIVMYDRISKKS